MMKNRTDRSMQKSDLKVCISVEKMDYEEGVEYDPRLASSYIDKSFLRLFNITVQSQNRPLAAHSVLIVFEISRIVTIICSVLGILSNFALITTIINTSFRHVSYGLLIVVIALSDILRLLSAISYYMMFAKLIPLNLITETIYIVSYRYPKFVSNWCKVLLAVERFMTVRYWERHTHTDWRSKYKRKQRRQFFYSILFVLIAGLVSQHPNLLWYRFESTHVDYKRLLLVNKINRSFIYGYHKYNLTLFTIISLLMLDNIMPILSLCAVNFALLRAIRRLPLSLQIKVRESIGILIFLTILSLTLVPRAFVVFYNLYSSDHHHKLSSNITIFFYIFQILDIVNHAITGFACFFSSALLRSELKNLFWSKHLVANIHKK